MLEHCKIAGRRPATLGQRIREQTTANFDSGFVRNLLDQRRAGDVFNKQRSCAIRFQLLDQRCQIFCGRLCFGVDANRSKEGQSVGICQIAKSVVRGDNGAAICWQGCELCFGFRVQRLQVCQQIAAPLSLRTTHLAIWQTPTA